MCPVDFPPDPPPSLDGKRAGELAAQTEAVLARQRRELEAAIAEAFEQVPAPLRGVVLTLGSLISARLTGLLDPGRAGEVSRHLSIDFLAQLAAELDPRRAVQVVTATEPERVLEVALVMAAREEYVAMGRFVAYVDDEALAACIEGLGDEEVLRVTFVMEGKERLERIVELVGLERMRRMLGAADLQGLGEEARDLLDHLSPGQRRRLSGQPGR